MSNWIFVDVEARGKSPLNGTMTEFGAVHEASRKTFHGVLYEGKPDPDNPAVPIIGRQIAHENIMAIRFRDWLGEVGGNERPIFVSDNPAYDFMWIAGLFDAAGLDNPFSHSGRRISDFWAGLQHNWGDTQSWKRFRQTPHDHNPVNDAMGNVEAFQHIKELAKTLRSQERGNDLVVTGRAGKITVSNPTKEAIEDKLNDILWKYGVWEDLPNDKLIKFSKDLKNLITTETTKARIDELERETQEEARMFKEGQYPDTSNYRATRLAALQKEQKR